MIKERTRQELNTLFKETVGFLPVQIPQKSIDALEKLLETPNGIARLLLTKPEEVKELFYMLAQSGKPAYEDLLYKALMQENAIGALICDHTNMDLTDIECFIDLLAPFAPDEQFNLLNVYATTEGTLDTYILDTDPSIDFAALSKEHTTKLLNITNGFDPDDAADILVDGGILPSLIRNQWAEPKKEGKIITGPIAAWIRKMSETRFKTIFEGDNKHKSPYYNYRSVRNAGSRTIERRAGPYKTQRSWKP